jgi:hypothetical protein
LSDELGAYECSSLSDSLATTTTFFFFFFGAVVATVAVVGAFVGLIGVGSIGADTGTGAGSGAGAGTDIGCSTVCSEAFSAALISSTAVPLGLPPAVPFARCVPVYCLGATLFFFLMGTCAASCIFCSIAKTSAKGKKLRVLGS